MKRIILIGLGLLSCCLGIIWLQCNNEESHRAATAAATVLPKLEQHIPEVDLTSDGLKMPIQETQILPEMEIDGKSYVGILEIPALELRLPVVSFWSDENGKIAPCRYSGNILDKNLVICAHNYKSHFGLLPSLDIGDSVYFIDMAGAVYSYLVSEKLVISGTDADKLATGEWGLTLFTCTNSGKSRYIVRCNLQE